MKKTIILVTLCAVGLLTGYGGRRLTSGDLPAASQPTASPTESAPAISSARSDSTRPGKSSSDRKATLPAISISRSTDTVASILALDPEKNYARIALWTATASEADLAAYWTGYKGGRRSVDVTDLIFLNWTRRNPQAAVTAVAGTPDDRYAWWSWASNDPQAALTASLAAGKGQQEQVACGIGDFNPDWLRAHLDQIPEEFRDDAFSRMKNWPDSQNPLESLTFMRDNGIGFDQETFKSLVRKDPWSALDWLKENPGLGQNQYSKENTSFTTLVSILGEERPEDLARIAAQTPPGEMKRKMDQAIFDRLLESDPAAALEQARKIEVPLIASQRLAKVGLGLISTDPDQAFQLAGEVLKATPDHLDVMQKVEYASGWTGSPQKGPATQLMDVLFSKDREKTLKLMADNSGEEPRPEILFDYAEKWAASDLVSFSEWANQQTGKLHAIAAQQIGNKLAAQGNYTEAIEWAASGTLAPEQAYSNILYQWTRNDAAAAAAWLENSNLTAEQKENYRSFLKRNSR